MLAGMNSQSSRSHSVFLLVVSQKNTRDGSSASGRLYLVDLVATDSCLRFKFQGWFRESGKN